MSRIFDIVFGYLLVIVDDECVCKLFELLREYGIASHITRRVDGGLKLRVPYSARDQINTLRLGDSGVYIRECGVPAAIKRYRKRFGLFIGIALSLLLSWQSGKIIWSFSVSGNKSVSEKEILTALDELGCSLGSRIDKINFDLLHNDLALKLDGIAWISVNMKGSLARVEVREVKSPDAEELPMCSNIVAAEDGQIELIECFDGVRCAEIGEVVRKGQLLISGVYEDKNGAVTYTRAAGKALARVSRCIRVEIPSVSEKKVYSGERITDYTVNILGKSINISNWGSINSSMYDKIVSEEKLHIFSYELPIIVTREERIGYEIDQFELSREEAAAEALISLRSQRDSVLCDAELISESITAYFDDDTYVIECNMVCLVDIARSLPIELLPDGAAQSNI